MRPWEQWPRFRVPSLEHSRGREGSACARNGRPAAQNEYLTARAAEHAPFIKRFVVGYHEGRGASTGLHEEIHYFLPRSLANNTHGASGSQALRAGRGPPAQALQNPFAPRGVDSRPPPAPMLSSPLACDPLQGSGEAQHWSRAPHSPSTHTYTIGTVCPSITFRQVIPSVGMLLPPS